MRRTLLLLAFCFATIGLWASRAYPGFVTVQQKDGTELTIKLVGNAEISYNMTTDGVILFQNGTDYYVAAIDESGEMTSTGILAHNAGNRTAQELAAIKAQNTTKFNEQIVRKANIKRANTMRDANPAYFPHTGKPKVLVILAQFQDVKFRDGNCWDVFNEYLNKTDAAITVEGDSTKTSVQMNYCSVRQFFKSCSYGQFEPQFELYGPITLSENMASYGTDTGGRDKNVKLKFLPEVVDSADAAGVDFTEFDSNNDGYVDLVYIIYAGYGQNIGGNSSDCIWPHVSAYDIGTYDGKKLYRYGLSNELNLSPQHTGNVTYYGVVNNRTNLINGIGVFTHEFSHGMGLPDLYPSNNLTKAALTCNQNLDNYDLMDGGEYSGYAGTNPKSYLAWERERCEWMQIEELTNPANITMETINKGGNAYKIVNDNNPSEYIVLENIQKTGMDSYAPGHGMLVYRIDEGQGLDLGYVNQTALSPAVAIVAADSLFMPDWFGKQKKVTVTETGYTVDGYNDPRNPLIIDPILVQKYKNTIMQTTETDKSGTAIYNREAAGDPWPGISNVTEMTGESYYAFSTVKSFMQGKPVTEIKEEDSVITFKFMGGDVDGIININANDNTSDNRIADKKVYTIDGRLAGTSLEGLRPGIYIQNNKKIVVKQ